MATLYGDQNSQDLNDTLTGTAEPDQIYAGQGNDTVYADAGDDVVNGDVGDDTLYGGSGADTLLGGDGNDRIIIESGYYTTATDEFGNTVTTYYDSNPGDGALPDARDTVNGGAGNDSYAIAGAADIVFDTNFGRDCIHSAGEGSRIIFNFQRPDGTQLHRNHQDLYLETSEGWLKIAGYFEHPERYEILFHDANGQATDALSANTIQTTFMNGDANDNTIGVRFEELPTGDIILNAGGGDDYVEVRGDQSLADRLAIVDGGAGDDIYLLQARQVQLTLGRDSGRDLYMNAITPGAAQQQVTIVIDQSAAPISSADISVRYENGLLVLGIANADAGIVLGLDVAQQILLDQASWHVQVGSESLDVKALIQQMPIIQSGQLVLVDQTMSYDGNSNATNETILGPAQVVISGTDNETILGAQRIEFNGNFGHDVVINPNGQHAFQQDASAYTYAREGSHLRITDGGGNDVLVKSYFISSWSSSTNLQFNGTTLSRTDLSAYLTANSSAEMLYLEAGVDASAGPATDAAAQTIYADLGTTIVNGGSGNNTIITGGQTTVIHDTALGGHDNLLSNGSAGNPHIRVLVDDVANLQFDVLADGQLRLSHRNTASAITYAMASDLVLVDGQGMETHLSPSDIAHQIELSNASYYTVAVADSATAGWGPGWHLQSASSGTNDTLDGRRTNVVFGEALTFDGHGGSDTYFGATTSDTFIYSGGGNDIIKGTATNAAATIGYDSADFKTAGISKSALNNAFSRSGDNLVFVDGDGGTLTIEGFFTPAAQEAALENFILRQMTGEPVLGLPPSHQDIQVMTSLFRGMAITNTPFSVTHVIDSLHFTDGIVSYAEIAALFPAAPSDPSDGNDVLHGSDTEADTIDGLGGNDTIYGQGGDDTLIGSAGNDQLFGGAGNDVLDGGAGSNTLDGGAGDDNYAVSSDSDTIIELADAGHDMVTASVSVTLADNVEDLVLAGTDNLNGTGNTLDNTLQGNEGNNLLDGGAGGDMLLGGLGDDTYYVDNLGDYVLENAGEGYDTVYSSVELPLMENAEKLVATGNSDLSLTGNDLDNLLIGNAGANTLSGGAGIDQLRGGAGDDLYILGSGDSGDIVNENASEGLDTVQAAFGYTLTANVENLVLTGTAAINGTGNGGDNSLTGNDAVNTLNGGGGNDWLDGGLGNDILRGGSGNDTYVIGSGDTITENASAGTDTVRSAISYALGANLENLTLTGTGNLSGTGNNLVNVLTGNAGNNTLNAGAGADTLQGSAGNDTLIGGAGNDTYLFGRGDGADTLTENDATAGNTDKLLLAGVNHDQLWFRSVGKNLEVSVIGTTDKVTFANWNMGTARQVEQLIASDNLMITNTQVANLVQAYANSGLQPPPAGQTSLTPEYQQALAPALAAWH